MENNIEETPSTKSISTLKLIQARIEKETDANSKEMWEMIRDEFTEMKKQMNKAKKTKRKIKKLLTKKGGEITV